MVIRSVCSIILESRIFNRDEDDGCLRGFQMFLSRRLRFGGHARAIVGCASQTDGARICQLTESATIHDRRFVLA